MLLTPQEFEPLVTKSIHSIISKEKERAKGEIEFLPEHLDYLGKLAVTNGKKIRAYLIYLGYHLYGTDEKLEDILMLASAIEIFHTAILIHDDITDQSLLRRGLDSFHIFEESVFKDKHIAQNVAMYFGDFGLFLAQDVITRCTQIDKGLINKILQEFNRIALDLAYGQIYDTVSSYNALSALPFTELLRVYNLKTGTYTFLLPLRMGIIASGKLSKYETLNSFSKNAGIVFQMTDDLLDILSDSEKTGKPRCNDLKEGKLNSIIRIMLDETNKEDRQYIENILEKKEEIDEERIESILKQRNIYSRTEKELTQYIKQASKSIENVDGNIEVKTILKKLVNDFKNREK